MRILAIDTALSACSVGIFDDDHGGVIASQTIAMDRGHAEAIIPIISEEMEKVPGSFGSLDRICVTVGPGSFTGIRVGISAARAIGLALQIPVVGVATLSALAAPLVLDGSTGNVVAIIDARHGNIYITAYAHGGRMFLTPRILAVRDALRLLGSGPFRFVGPGAPLLAIEAWSLGYVAEVEGEMISPDISFVARLGMVADPASAPPRPLYIKAPDAKPQGATHIERLEA